MLYGERKQTPILIHHGKRTASIHMVNDMEICEYRLRGGNWGRLVAVPV